MRTPYPGSARIAALVIVAVAPAAWGQSAYLIAEPARAAPGQTVRVQLASGPPFAGPGAVLAWDAPPERLWNAGRTRLALEAEGGAATFTPDEPGIQLLAFTRGARDASPVASWGKAIVVVAGPSSGEQIWRSELGQRLEIVLRTDPREIAARGGAIEVQVLHEREPLAGATITAVAEGGGPEGHKRRTATDATGRARFDLDHPGRWLVHLAHEVAEGGEAGRRVRLESSLLLDAGP